MSDAKFETILAGLDDGSVVPYLGAGALSAVTDEESGDPIPADSDSLILAMNQGRPMAPKLMYEFPRAAMNLELKRGRSFVNRFLAKLYNEGKWSEGPLHGWLAERKLPYIVDANRDIQLQTRYRDRPHIVIQGVSRIGGTEYRFKLFQYDGETYHEATLDEIDATLPILFKPLGSPIPEVNFVASDADFVDYITELMGGFAIPQFLKGYRKEKQYLFLGMRFTRDTERMVMSDIVYGAGSPTGWALIPEPTEKERRFCAKKGVEVIEADWSELMAFAGAESTAAA